MDKNAEIAIIRAADARRLGAGHNLAGRPRSASPRQQEGRGPGRDDARVPQLSGGAVRHEEYLFRKFGTARRPPPAGRRQSGPNPKGFSETQLGLNYQADGPWTIFLPEREGSAETRFNAMKSVDPTALANPAAGLYSETNTRKGGQIGDVMSTRSPTTSFKAASPFRPGRRGEEVEERRRRQDRRRTRPGAEVVPLITSEGTPLNSSQAVRFAAVGLDHAHIFGQVAGLIAAGATFAGMATDDPSAAVAGTMWERIPTYRH